MELKILAVGRSTSPDHTEALGRALGEAAQPGTVIALRGDLGSGKTCFVRGLARGLGLEQPIGSPTYTLMQTHEGGRLDLHHFDAWMEGRQKAFLGDGALEAWHGEGLSVVEWAERLGDWLPDPHVDIDLRHCAGEDSHEFRDIRLGIRGSCGLPWLERALEDLQRGDILKWEPPKNDSCGEPQESPGRLEQR